MNQEFKRYSELTDSEKSQIIELITRGAEVNPTTLPFRLEESEIVGFWIDNGIIIATATIKKPLRSYIQYVFSNAKTDLNYTDYNFELGYVYVDEKCRNQKLALRLCRHLCEIFLSEKIFATTRTDNYSMQSILTKLYFTLEGEKYANRNRTSFLQLYIKPKIMDTYHINLGKTKFGKEILWSGTVTKLRKPTPGQKITISMSESIARENKNTAENDIIHEINQIDFENNEVIFVPTYERISSIEDLKDKLSSVS